MNETVQFSTAQVESTEKALSTLENYINFFPAPVYVIDPNRMEFLSINGGLRELLGFSESDVELLRFDVSSLIHQEDDALFRSTLENLKTGVYGLTHTFVVRFKKKDGGCIYARNLCRVFEDERWPQGSILCAVENITEQVRAEEELHAIRQLFDETERLILFGTWSWTPSTDKLEWTDGMYALLEYERGEVGHVDNEFFDKHIVADQIDVLRQAVAEAREQKKDFDREFVIRTHNGREKYVQSKGKPILDKDGNIKKVVGITRDVTHKKTFEKERERYIRELNRSNKELEEFAYVASHDMHEPLRKILTFSERLRNKYMDALGDDGKLYLERISASAGNMRNLIDNLLEFSRVSRGTRNFERCDLNVILRDVISDQELKIEETGTRISVGQLPEIEGVHSELRQLFNNLIGNALKFRKKDTPPEIKISGHRLTHREKSDLLLPFNQPFFRIDVADNGIGFEGIYAEKIFEIFQRLHGKSEYSGSGIGLAICKKIAENHGGSIHATGAADSGATFSVILPEKQNH